MATQVNWNTPSPFPQPRAEIAGISDLLGAIADAREKKRQFEANLAQQKAEADQLAQHQAALEKYNQDNLNQQVTHQTAETARLQQKAQAQQLQHQQEQANPHMGDIRSALDKGDTQGARELGGQYGVGVNRNEKLIQDRALKAGQARGDQFNAGMQSLGSYGILGGLPELPPQVQQAAEKETIGASAPTQEELNPAAREAPYQLTMPAGQVLDYDPGAARAAGGAERGRRQQEFMQAHEQSLGQDELGQRALVEVGNRIASPDYKGDPYKDVAALHQHLQDQANTNQRAKDAAAARAKPPAVEGAFNKDVDLANNRALSRLAERRKAFVVNSGFNKFVASKNEIQSTRANLESNNPVGTAHAIEKITALGRMGMATTPALKLTTEHLSGLLGKGDTYIQKVWNGDQGEEAKDNLAHALQTMEAAADEHIKKAHQQWVGSEYTPANKNIKGNIEDMEMGLFQSVMPPGWEPDYDPEALQVQPASGQPPSRTGRGKARQGQAGGAPPARGGVNLINSGPTGGFPSVPGKLPTAAEAAGSGGQSLPGGSHGGYGEPPGGARGPGASKGGGGNATAQKLKLLQQMLIELRAARQPGGTR